jgi:hypothetical protein
MADPLVSSVPNVDNNIAYRPDDRRQSFSRRRESLSGEPNSDPEEPDHTTDAKTTTADIEAGLGVNVNREV